MGYEGVRIIPPQQPERLLTAVAMALLLVMVSCRIGGSGRAIAADPLPATSTNQTSALKPDTAPLDVNALQPGNAPPSLVTATSISLTQLTIPSLWWLREQIAADDAYGSKLVENWLAYPHSSSHPGRVDLVVNRQFWSLLDYLDRYAFIHAFGKAARDYGYNVRVFDSQATLLGASTCDFSTIDRGTLQSGQQSHDQAEAASPDRPSAPSVPPQAVDALRCNILLDSSGKAGLRGSSTQLPGVSSPKALDIAQP